MQTTNRRDALKSILQFMGLASIGALSWGAYLKSPPYSIHPELEKILVKLASAVDYA